MTIEPGAHASQGRRHTTATHHNACHAHHPRHDTNHHSTGDPSCSPVDTGITLMLKNGENLSQGIPAEMHDVTKDQVRQTVGMILEPPGQPAKPQMSADGQEVFQSIINGMFTELDSLPTQQKMLVCDNVLEAVDNYQYALMKQMQARAK
mmetsp:Transcript_109896/g.319808  ORF Transcript_109896/g.319808 Transcript_109896/m.319808 type:complete len:150 (+) Transcript_109896:608-1057(+)